MFEFLKFVAIDLAQRAVRSVPFTFATKSYIQSLKTQARFASESAHDAIVKFKCEQDKSDHLIYTTQKAIQEHLEMTGKVAALQKRIEYLQERNRRLIADNTNFRNEVSALKESNSVLQAKIDNEKRFKAFGNV